MSRYAVRYFATIAGMLIGFRLNNFRCFMTEQTFSFAASPDRTHEATHLMRTGLKSVPKLSKAAIVFGPNASGKSNLLIGLRTLQTLMLHSTDQPDAQFAELYTPFRFGPAAGRPTEFELDLLLGSVRYRYALSYDAQRIRSERLLVYRTGKSQRWFERRFDDSVQREEWAPFSPSFNGPREIWRKATRPSALFLTTAARLNSEQLAPLLKWAEQSLRVLGPVEIGDFDRVSARLRDRHFKGRLIRLLRASGIEIEDVRVAEAAAVPPGETTPDGGHQRHGGARPCIEFLYNRPGWAPVWADSVFESAGVHRLMSLFVPVAEAIDDGKVLLIDEFDTSLHPLIARFLIQLVSNPEVSDKGSQLLMTSHNITLMDLDILRRDQIWLMHIDEHHASVLTSLVRASPRKNEMIAKNYLKGRYSAIPDVRPKLFDR